MIALGLFFLLMAAYAWWGFSVLSARPPLNSTSVPGPYDYSHAEVLKARYEKEFGEPYSALEARVKARHPWYFKED